MVSFNFKQLSETSELLVGSEPLPTLKRDVSQIRKETETMSKRLKTNPQLLAQGHYLLAQGGINSQELAQNLNAVKKVHLVPRPDIINNTDVEGYLQQRHEMDIIDTIEELRQKTDSHVDDLQDKLFEKEFKHLMSRVKETQAMASSHQKETDPHAQFMNMSTNMKLKSQLGEQMEEYAKVVIETNEKRLQNMDHPIIKAFSNVMVNNNTMDELATQSMDIDSMDTRTKDRRVTDAWLLLDKLAGESEASVNDRIQGRFINTYLNVASDSDVALDTRRLLIKRSKAWLESQMVEYMDAILLQHAHQIKPGGNPSFLHRLQFYLKLTFKKHGQWQDDLEIVQDVPIWTFIYMSFRSGQEHLMLEYIDQHPSMFESQSRYVGYIKEYLSNPNRCLSQETQARVMMDFQLMEYSNQKVDPYKLILTKILGRCGLNKKTHRTVIKAAEDYLWLQLTLIRENLDEHNYWEEKYTLYDLQQLIINYGPVLFDPTGTAPWIYFKVLLVTLQFEQAINYMYKNEGTRLQSIHFAMALMYYGLLRIPKEPMQTSIDFLIMENNTATLNMTRMIYQYLHNNTSTHQDMDTRHLRSSSLKKKQQQQPYIIQHPKNSIHYLFFMTMYSTRNGYSNDNLVNMARSYVRGLVLDNDDYKMFLGSSSSETGKVPGYIEYFKSLLGIDNEQDYIQHLLEPIAQKYTDRGKYPQAVYVYELSGDYNRVLNIFNHRLGLALRPHPIERTEKMTLSQLVEFIQSTMVRYQQHQHLPQLLDDSKRRTVDVLIQFVKGKEHYDQGRYHQALKTIGLTGVIPIGKGVCESVEQLKLLDTIICNSLPDVLLMTMDALYKLCKSYVDSNDSSRLAIQQRLKVLEKESNALIAFSGMLNMKIPNDAIVTLIRSNRKVDED
ncbi:Nup93/Nic96-domain-containing protein [Chlamydoabsidia padenii]|nr:Nup93/Nic96-domain-containing protein [Chlamydoabsidia padenii]